MSQTGKVGTYLGMNIPSTAVFADGFADGIAMYNQDNDKNVQLIGWVKGKQDGTMVIWVDADGYETQPEYGNIILTSVLKEISNAVYDTIESVVEGTFTSGNYVGTLKNGGVGLAPWHDFEDKVPQELKSEIDQIRERIISGDISVESDNAPTAE